MKYGKCGSKNNVCRNRRVSANDTLVIEVDKFMYLFILEVQ
jgi:hypothetical protein